MVLYLLLKLLSSLRDLITYIILLFGVIVLTICCDVSFTSGYVGTWNDDNRYHASLQQNRKQGQLLLYTSSLKLNLLKMHKSYPKNS